MEDASALDRLAEAAGALPDWPPLAAFESRLRAAMADVSDLATELRSVVETWEDDPERLEQVRSRRQMLHELERKYGADLDEVLAFAAEARERMAAIDLQEQRAEALDAEIAAARGVLGHGRGRGGLGATGGRAPDGRPDPGHPASAGHAVGPVLHRGRTETVRPTR